MIVKHVGGDLNKAYRPCKIDEVIGNETIKKMVKNALESKRFPHASLFTGPSGCGKTTFARIVALGLNCVDGPTGNPCCKCDSCKSIINGNSFAVIEIDAGRTRDVAMTRKILDDLPAASLGGESYKIAIFDEAHLLGEGNAKSEEALLKFLEDTPEHVYLILCTNEPQKLRDVTRNRCKVVQFGRLTTNDIHTLLVQVSQFEGFVYKDEVLKYVAEEVNGVPRAALSALQQIASEGSWTKENASLIINSGVDADNVEVYEFSKMLIKNGWVDIKTAFDKIKSLPAETIRIAVVGFLVGCVKNARDYDQAERYAKMAETMSYIYYGPKPEHVLFIKLCQALRYRKAA